MPKYLFLLLAMLFPLFAQPSFSTKQQLPKSTYPQFVPGSRPPIWSAGSLLSWEGDGTQVPTIHSVDLAGQDYPIPLIIPEAKTVHIDSVARSSDGATGIVGLAFDSSGHGAGYVSIITGDWRAATIVRMSAYFPQLVVFGGDGSLWTKGWEPSDPETRKEINPKAGAIRHFDRNGKALGAFLPQGSLHIERHVFTSANGFLLASSSKIGWEQAFNGPYYELLQDGTHLNEYPGVPLHKGELLVGMALTDTDAVLATTSVSAKDAEIPGGQYLYFLDRAERVWRRVDLPPTSSPAAVSLLLGSQGNTLVFRSKEPGINWMIEVNQ